MDKTCSHCGWMVTDIELSLLGGCLCQGTRDNLDQVLEIMRKPCKPIRLVSDGLGTRISVDIYEEVN